MKFLAKEISAEKKKAAAEQTHLSGREKKARRNLGQTDRKITLPQKNSPSKRNSAYSSGDIGVTSRAVPFSVREKYL